MKLEPQIIRDFRSGMNDSVSTYLMPDYMLRYCMNAYTDEWNKNQLGDIKQIPGYAIIKGEIENGKDVLGLHNFLNAANTTSRLIAVMNDSGDTESRTYYYNVAGNSWDEIGAIPINWTAGKKMRFETFLDYVYAANGTDNIKSWDGVPGNNWGTTNLVDAPKGSLIINFFDRLNISGNSTYPSRVYSSSFPAADYTMTWPGAGVESARDSIDVNPDDNDKVTALANIGNLIIFKKRGMYIWNGQSSQGDKLIDIGAVNQEVVKQIKGKTYFFGESKDSGAIYSYSGEYPQEISKPVRKWIDSIATTAYDNFGSWVDDDNYYLSVGDVTYEGVDYSNVVLRYNTSNQTWSTMTFPDKPIVSTDRILTTGARTVVFGDTDGSVYTWNSGNTFNGSDINTTIRTKELEFGSRARTKTVKAFAAYSSAPQGAVVRVKIDGGQWATIGKLDKTINHFNTNLVGKYFEFEVGTSNSQEPFVFDGFEFYNVEMEGYPR